MTAVTPGSGRGDAAAAGVGEDGLPAPEDEAGVGVAGDRADQDSRECGSRTSALWQMDAVERRYGSGVIWRCRER